MRMLSHVWLFVTLWTVACQDPLSMEFFQAWILEWVAISYFRGSSWPRNRTHLSCFGQWILYRWVTWEAQTEYLHPFKIQMLKPNPQCDDDWGRAFGRWLGHEDGTLLNGMKKMSRREPWSLPSCEDSGRAWLTRTRKWVLTRQSLQPLSSWTSQSQKWWEINFCCS